MKKVTLMLKDLACPDCAQKIGQILEKTDGVHKAKVFYATSKAKVEYDAEAIDQEKIIDIIEKVGYKVIS